MTEVAEKTCEGCGAVITPQEIMQRQAGLVQGVLLCPECVAKKRQQVMEAQRLAAAAAPKDISEEKISLDGNLDEAPTGPTKIRSFASGSTLAGAHHDADLKRGVSASSDPPTRIRTFHSKLTPAALAHMDDLINEWIDAHPEIHIKLVATTVGPFEAKHVEQHLIVNIFY